MACPLIRLACDARGIPANVLLRVLVGPVFLAEGIQKFLFPDALGVGRFLLVAGGGPWSFDSRLTARR